MGKKRERKKAKMLAEQGVFVESAPYVAGSPTSKAAADEIEPHVVNLKERVYRYIQQYGPACDDQIAYALHMNPSTARPRRVELVKAGRVVQVGEGKTSSGRKAALWGLP